MTASNTNTNTTYAQPTVPALFFEENQNSFSSNGNNDCRTQTASSSTSTQLPTELLAHCLTAYADWGDLAKLACVQKSWKNIVTETANQSSQSKWELAQALLEGDCGLAKNPVKAVQLLKELSSEVKVDESGTPVNMSDSTETGYNNNNSSNDSGEYFTAATKQLAECYMEGNGVEKNTATGSAWLEAAFYYGNDSEAAHDIALNYEYGRFEVKVDPNVAAQWFERAADNGHVEAMAELGLCYELGCGVEQSDEDALDWYTKAANLGHATAKFSVGEIFEEARGVPQSDEEACLWYYKAAIVGDEDSKQALRRLYDIARIVILAE
ncbi:MAG: hypothetical protein SGARI_000193 [Bacillariaceae sp.]